jgi:hypothetical protein
MRRRGVGEVVTRFAVEKLSGPGDAVYDSARGDEAPPATVVKIGHAPSWIDGANYEHDRILDLLHQAGMTAAISLIAA